MAISTKSLFYYGVSVASNVNQYVNFSEGAGAELSGMFPVGNYSMYNSVLKLQSVLNDKGSLDYTVTLNRSTRKVTISTTSNFTIKAATGSQAASSLWSWFGFTTDRTGSNSYTSNGVIGSQYEPQFYLQNYISSDDYKVSVSEKINQSASGNLEVVRFGNVNKTQFSIEYATNIVQNTGSVITNDASGVANLRSFMTSITNKIPIEFMPNKSSPDTYETLLLESTEASSNGTGFKLNEMYSNGLPFYFSSGTLTFRKI